MRNIGLWCPYCSSKTLAKKTRPLSVLLKEITYQCQNAECGYAFIASLEVVRTLSLSSYANPEIQVPLSRHINWSAIKQLNLNQCAG